jgi:hypothetical protein
MNAGTVALPKLAVATANAPASCVEKGIDRTSLFEAVAAIICNDSTLSVVLMLVYPNA